MAAFFKRHHRPVHVYLFGPHFAAGVAPPVAAPEVAGRGVAVTGQMIVAGSAALYDDVTAVVSAGNRATSEPPSGDPLQRIAQVAGSAPQLAALDGDFAAAVHDVAANTLTLVRDHFGSVPLYYSQYGEAAAFASLPPPLLCVPWATRQLDDVALASYLKLLAPGLERTFYRSVKSLLPASRITFGGTAPAVGHKYWRPRAVAGFSASASPDEIYGAVREQLVRAVTSRACNSEPAGVWLSGGLDSSSVAAIACHSQPGRKFKAVCSALPPGTEGPVRDERIYVEAMRRKYPGLQVGYVLAPAADTLAGVEPFAQWLGAPVIDLFFYMTESLWHACTSDGATRIFTGEGGDYCISMRAGGAALVEALRTGSPRMFVQELRRLQQIGQTGANAVLWNYLAPVIAPKRLLQLRRWLKGPLPDILSLAMRSRPDLQQHLANCAAVAPPRAASMEEQERNYVAGLDVRDNITFWLLATATPGGSSAVNPLLDRRLIETCMAVPTALKVGAERDRLMIRRAGAPYLPEVIAARPDKGMFSPDVARRWQAAAPAMRDGLERASRHDRFASLVNMETVRAGLDALQRPNTSGLPGDAALTVVAPYFLARFLEFEDGRRS